jgi:hypothetical protein
MNLAERLFVGLAVVSGAALLAAFAAAYWMMREQIAILAAGS